MLTSIFTMVFLLNSGFFQSVSISDSISDQHELVNRKLKQPKNIASIRFRGPEIKLAIRIIPEDDGVGEIGIRRHCENLGNGGVFIGDARKFNYITHVESLLARR